MDKKPTPDQIKRFHTLLSATGLMNQKRHIIHGASFGRTEHTGELTSEEIDGLISSLSSQQGDHNFKLDECNRMRRKLISLSYEMGWADAGDWREAVKRIDAFLMGDKSTVKKPLNRLKYAELIHVVSQFNEMYRKYIEKVS